MQATIQRRIVSSLLLMRMTPLPDPSASKMPARKPLRHSSLGFNGQRISCAMRSHCGRDCVRIARAGRVRSEPA